MCTVRQPRATVVAAFATRRFRGHARPAKRAIASPALVVRRSPGRPPAAANVRGRSAIGCAGSARRPAPAPAAWPATPPPSHAAAAAPVRWSVDRCRGCGGPADASAAAPDRRCPARAAGVAAASGPQDCAPPCPASGRQTMPIRRRRWQRQPAAARRSPARRRRRGIPSRRRTAARAPAPTTAPRCPATVRSVDAVAGPGPGR